MNIKHRAPGLQVLVAGELGTHPSRGGLALAGVLLLGPSTGLTEVGAAAAELQSPAGFVPRVPRSQDPRSRAHLAPLQLCAFGGES